MSQTKNVKATLALSFLTCLESLGCATYLLMLPGDPKHSVLLGYSSLRLVTILGVLLAFGVSLAFLYLINRNPQKTDALISHFFEDKRRLRLFLSGALLTLLAGLLIWRANPSFFPEIKHYYYLGYVSIPTVIAWVKAEAMLTRLQPVAVWACLVSSQIATGILVLNRDKIRADVQADLIRGYSKTILTLTVLASLSIIWVGFSKVLPFILVDKFIEASQFAQCEEMIWLHNYAWLGTVGINLLAGWLGFNWFQTRAGSVHWWAMAASLLLALMVSYVLLTGFPTYSPLTIRYEDRWNVFYLTPDSSGYVNEYNPASSRPPVYPLFIQMLTSGTGFKHTLEGLPRREPIGDLNHPLMRVARGQTVFYLLASLAACAAIMLLLNSALPVPFFLWLYEYGYFCQESNTIMAEALAQAWLFLLLAVFFLSLGKRSAYLLLLSGLFSAALYLTRPAGVYGLVILAATLLWAARGNWQQFWRPAVLTLFLAAALAALPSLFTFSATGSLTPTAGYSRTRIGFALQVATPDDIPLMPDKDSKFFLSKALELKQIEEAKVNTIYPQEPEHTFNMIGKNIYSVAAVAVNEVLPKASSLEADRLLLNVSKSLLEQHRIAYYLIGWNSFWYATTRLSMNRMINPAGFWGVVGLCLLLTFYLRGWVGYSSSVLLLTHLTHLGVVSLFDIPIQRYLWATEFLVLLAVFILGWGFFTLWMNRKRTS